MRNKPKKERYAVCITETLQRVVIIEADNELDACDIARDCYRKEEIYLNADNSNVDVSFDYDREYEIDDKEGYIDSNGIRWVYFANGIIYD